LGEVIEERPKPHKLEGEGWKKKAERHCEAFLRALKIPGLIEPNDTVQT
jgi:hypothetical protein